MCEFAGNLKHELTQNDTPYGSTSAHNVYTQVPTYPRGVRDVRHGELVALESDIQSTCSGRES
eukprot:4641525-Pleurochrysis_carterae.AAC.1